MNKILITAILISLLGIHANAANTVLHCSLINSTVTPEFSLNLTEPSDGKFQVDEDPTSPSINYDDYGFVTQFGCTNDNYGIYHGACSEDENTLYITESWSGWANIQVDAQLDKKSNQLAVVLKEKQFLIYHTKEEFLFNCK